jgi:hypothetical protein
MLAGRRAERHPPRTIRSRPAPSPSAGGGSYVAPAALTTVMNAVTRAASIADLDSSLAEVDDQPVQAVQAAWVWLHPCRGLGRLPREHAAGQPWRARQKLVSLGRARPQHNGLQQLLDRAKAEVPLQPAPARRDHGPAGGGRAPTSLLFPWALPTAFATSAPVTSDGLVVGAPAAAVTAIEEVAAVGPALTGSPPGRRGPRLF